MDINKQDITINKYITGELEGSELEAFEQRLQQDKALAKDVKFYRKLEEGLEEHYQNNAAIDENERKAFKQLLSEVMEDEVVHNPDDEIYPPGIIIKLIPLFTIAAAAFILLFGGWLLTNSLNKNSNLADDFFQPYQYNKSATLSLDKENFDQINLYLMDSGIDSDTEKLNYLNNAIPQLNTDNLEEQLLKGNIEYVLEKHNDAINSFNEVIEKTGNSNLKNTAIWYKALTYLKKENKNETIKLLQQLPGSADFYEQAQDLIKELK